MEKLLPCPFCPDGGLPAVGFGEGAENTGCEKCGVVVKDAASWNERYTRPVQSPPAEDERVKALVEAGNKLRKYHAFIPDALLFAEFEEALTRLQGEKEKKA